MCAAVLWDTGASMTGPVRGGGSFGVGVGLVGGSLFCGGWAARCCLRKCDADAPDRVRIHLILEALVRLGGRLVRLGLARPGLARWLRA